MSERFLVLKRVGRGRWEKTCWTDLSGSRPRPVGVEKAKDALRRARSLYPDVKYKLSVPPSTKAKRKA